MRRLVSFLLIFALLVSGCRPGLRDRGKDRVQEPEVPAPITEDLEEDEEEEPEEETDGDVVFYEEVERWVNPDFMDSYTAELTSAYNDMMSLTGTDWAVSWEDISGMFEWYKAGTVKENHEYGGDEYLVLHNLCEGPCFSQFVYRFLYSAETGELVYLPQHSNEYASDTLAPLLENSDDDLLLEGVELPDEIELPDFGVTLNLAQKDQSYPSDLSDSEYYTVFYEDPELGTLYSAASQGCFYIETPDGSVSRYEYDPGLGILGSAGIDADPGEEVMITWNDGTQTNLSTGYSYKTGACGITGHCYMTEDVSADQLDKVGTSENGVDFFTVKNPSKTASEEDGVSNSAQIALAESYQNYVGMYSYRAETEPDFQLYTFEEYLAIQPVLFWEDPFGRWSMLNHNDVKPFAECGKPVIYLYPETATDVRVKVDVAEFTVTDPLYGEEGWFVNAESDGTLYNYSDGETYPYLYWEGHSDQSVTPNGGFMVQRGDLEYFLWNSLGQLGLTKNEREDFMSFWLKRMLDFPHEYFYVSFLGTREFNKVAPLDITPQPNTLLRVFVYFQPTHRPFAVQEQIFPEPVERRGFTVVEWGGTSLLPWKK